MSCRCRIEGKKLATLMWLHEIISHKSMSCSYQFWEQSRKKHFTCRQHKCFNYQICCCLVLINSNVLASLPILIIITCILMLQQGLIVIKIQNLQHWLILLSHYLCPRLGSYRVPIESTVCSMQELVLNCILRRCFHVPIHLTKGWILHSHA